MPQSGEQVHLLSISLVFRSSLVWEVGGLISSLVAATKRREFLLVVEVHYVEAYSRCVGERLSGVLT
jgi:hypothetical protein